MRQSSLKKLARLEMAVFEFAWGYTNSYCRPTSPFCLTNGHFYLAFFYLCSTLTPLQTSCATWLGQRSHQRLYPPSRYSPISPDSTTKKPTLPNKKKLILHWIYHPNDIPRTILRRLYNTHCARLFEEHLDIQQFIIAFHSAPTLRSALTKAKLIQEPGKEASKYFDGELD